MGVCLICFGLAKFLQGREIKVQGVIGEPFRTVEYFFANNSTLVDVVKP